MWNDDEDGARCGARGEALRAVLGVRAVHGSREALLRAAFDLIDLTPGVRVVKRSLVWRCAGPVEHLCAGLGVATRATLEELMSMLAAVERRLAGDAVGADAPVVVELLWACDPRSGSSAMAAPLPAPVPPVNVAATTVSAQSPALPSGRIVLHPEARLRASVLGLLCLVEPGVQDPKTGRRLYDLLYSVPEPYLEAPRPFEASFSTESQLDGERVVQIAQAAERADLLAAAAELLGGAQRSAVPVGPATVFPTSTLAVSAMLPDHASDELRMVIWLRAVRAVMLQARYRLRRAVVLIDGAVAVHGLLFGAVAPRELELAEPQCSRVERAGGSWRAELGLARS